MHRQEQREGDWCLIRGFIAVIELILSERGAAERGRGGQRNACEGPERVAGAGRRAPSERLRVHGNRRAAGTGRCLPAICAARRASRSAPCPRKLSPAWRTRTSGTGSSNGGRGKALCKRRLVGEPREAGGAEGWGRHRALRAPALVVAGQGLSCFPLPRLKLEFSSVFFRHVNRLSRASQDVPQLRSAAVGLSPPLQGGAGAGDKWEGQKWKVKKYNCWSE